LKISTVISHYLPIDTKTSPEYSSSSSSGNLKGISLCPFHEDTKPSMHFSDQKQVFKCFACGAGGDIYKFVGKVSGESGDNDDIMKCNGRRVSIDHPVH
jgi:DNA primase